MKNIVIARKQLGLSERYVASLLLITVDDYLTIEKDGTNNQSHKFILSNLYGLSSEILFDEYKELNNVERLLKSFKKEVKL